MKRLYHFLGVIILIVILTKIDIQKLFFHLSKINIPLFILINSLIIPTLFLRVCRWKKILHAQGIEYPLADTFLAYLGGFYAGLVTPGRIGELIKIAYLKEDKNVAYSDSLASVFVDRVFDLYGLILIGGLGALNILINLKHSESILPVILIIVTILVISFLLLNRTLLEGFARLFYKLMFSNLDKNLLKGQLKSFLSAVKMTVAGRIYIVPLALTFLAFLIYFYQCYLLARLVSINIPFIMIVSFVAITSLVSMIPVTFFGIGTREITLVYLFGLIGFKAESAVTYSFLIFLSFYIITGLISFIGWVLKYRGRELKIS